MTQYVLERVRFPKSVALLCGEVLGYPTLKFMHNHHVAVAELSEMDFFFFLNILTEPAWIVST